MKGQVFKRCTRCPRRTRYRDGDEKCRECGSSEFSWNYLADVGRDPATGKRRRKWGGGFAKKGDAEAALREILAKVDRDRYVDPSKLTLGAFLLDQWLPAMQLTIAETTWEGYKGNVDRYIVPRLGEVALKDLKPPKINWMYADVRDHGRSRGTGKLSLKTVREVHVTLHRALEDAVRWDYLDQNPCDRVTAPSATAAKNGRKKAIKTWTAAEVNAFGIAIADHPFFELWLLDATTGIRRSELLGLRWKDVDLKNNRLAIRQVLVVVDGKGKFKDAPKSQNGYRTIRFPPRVGAALNDLRVRQLKTRLAADQWTDLDLLFCRKDGLPWHPDYVTDTLKKLILDSGLPEIRPLQDLRHTHATILIGEAGVNVKVVQERLGHHSHSFTADTYQHVIPGMDEAATAQFDDLVFGDTTRDAPEAEDRA